MCAHKIRCSPSDMPAAAPITLPADTFLRCGPAAVNLHRRGRVPSGRKTFCGAHNPGAVDHHRCKGDAMPLLCDFPVALFRAYVNPCGRNGNRRTIAATLSLLLRGGLTSGFPSVNRRRACGCAKAIGAMLISVSPPPPMPGLMEQSFCRPCF